MEPQRGARASARARVRAITGWTAAGAAALTAAFGVAGARHAQAANVSAPRSAPAPERAAQAAPQAIDPQLLVPGAPPAASSAPPSAMSGGS
jgi:hypothetical protein